MVPLGRVLGGSSAINLLSFAPPSKSILDVWEKLGNPGWDWNSFHASLTKSYSLTDSDNGPLKLSVPEDDEDWRWPAMWRDTLKGLGHPVDVSLYSAQGEQYGAALIADSIDKVTKQRSYAANYLGQVKDRENLTVWTGVVAEKILFDEERDKSGDLRAIGVVYTDTHGRTKTVTASKEVIITAGTFNSPKLLELSGIGDRGRLESLGISQILLDNPAVGQNLQNHIMCSLCFEVRPTQERGLGTMDSISRQDPAALGAAMETYTQRQAGPFSRSGTNATALLPLPTAALLKDNVIEMDRYLGKDTAAFVRQHEHFARSLLSSPTGPSAHYLTFAGFAAVAVADDGSMANPPADDKTYFTVAVSLAHPLSRGSSHITSTSASSRPTIDPAYLSHPLDLEVLSRHLQFVASTLSKSEPLASRITRRLGNAAVSADELEDLQNAKDFVASKATGAAHYVGTCSMLPRELGGGTFCSHKTVKGTCC